MDGLTGVSTTEQLEALTKGLCRVKVPETQKQGLDFTEILLGGILYLN